MLVVEQLVLGFIRRLEHVSCVVIALAVVQFFDERKTHKLVIL